jgi:hypothetical protein
MLTAALYIKLIVEIALMALVGQGVLAVLAGARRHQNVFYQLLAIISRPFVRATRFITPRLVLDQHVPLVTFFLLLFVWFAVTVYRIQTCVRIGVELCK